MYVGIFIKLVFKIIKKKNRNYLIPSTGRLLNKVQYPFNEILYCYYRNNVRFHDIEKCYNTQQDVVNEKSRSHRPYNMILFVITKPVNAFGGLTRTQAVTHCLKKWLASESGSPNPESLFKHLSAHTRRPKSGKVCTNTWTVTHWAALDGGIAQGCFSFSLVSFTTLIHFKCISNTCKPHSIFL